MKIGIIGTGNMGSGIGRLLAAKGHAVCFTGRDLEKASVLAKSIGEQASSTSLDRIALDRDIVVLATPYDAATEALEMAGPLEDKILVDVTNPLTPDFLTLTIGHGTSAAEQVAELVPGAKVVKAFNTVLAPVLHAGEPATPSESPTVFCCADDAAAKAVVIQLVRETGFDAVDAGPLQNARYVEPLAEQVIQQAYALGMGGGVGLKLIRSGAE